MRSLCLSGWCQVADQAVDPPAHHRICRHIYTSGDKEYVCQCKCHKPKGPKKQPWHSGVKHEGVRRNGAVGRRTRAATDDGGVLRPKRRRKSAGSVDGSPARTQRRRSGGGRS